MITRTEDFLKKVHPAFSDYSIDFLADGLRHVGFYPLTDKAVKPKLKSNDLQDFVYWKSREAIAFNVSRDCSHKMFIHYLCAIDYAIANNLEGKDAETALIRLYDYNYDASSDDFILNEHGFFMSSVSNKLTISEGYKMSALERRLFGHFEKRWI